MRGHGRRRCYVTRYRIDESPKRCNPHIIAHLRWHVASYRAIMIYAKNFIPGVLRILYYTSICEICFSSDEFHITTWHTFFNRRSILWERQPALIRASILPLSSRRRADRLESRLGPSTDIRIIIPICLTRDGINAGRDGEWPCWSEWTFATRGPSALNRVAL